MRQVQICLAATILGGSLALAIIGARVWGQPELPAKPAANVPTGPTVVEGSAIPTAGDPANLDLLIPVPPPIDVPVVDPAMARFLPGPAGSPMPPMTLPPTPPREFPEPVAKPVSETIELPNSLPPLPKPLALPTTEVPQINTNGPGNLTGPMPTGLPPVGPANPPSPSLDPITKNPDPIPVPPLVKETSLPRSDGSPTKAETGLQLEWIAPPAVRLGQPFDCQLVVRNVSGAALEQIKVRMPIASGVTCGKSEPMAVTDGQQLTWSLGTLGAGTTRKLDLQLVSQTRGPLHGQATVTFSSSVAYTVHVREPMLVVKLAMPPKVVAGEKVILNVSASNPGDGRTEMIKLKVKLPEGLEHPRGRTIDVDLGDLKANETRTAQIICLAKSGGLHHCQAAATADGNLTAADAGKIEVLLPRLDLAVQGPKLRYIDRHAVYVFKVTNPGTAPADNVIVQEVVPAGFKFHAASHGGRFDDNSRVVSWPVGDLLPGQSKEVQLDVVAVAHGDHRHVASVTSARGLKSDSTLVTRVEGLSSLLVELADTDDPVEVGGDTAYEIRVTNTGTKAEMNVEMVCSLPAQMDLKSAKCGAGCRYRVEGRDLIFEPLPRLAPRADVIYRIHVRGLTAGDVRCRVRVRSDGITDPIVREESTRIYNDEMPGR